jgi:hypothetical protein
MTQALVLTLKSSIVRPWSSLTGGNDVTTVGQYETGLEERAFVPAKMLICS